MTPTWPDAYRQMSDVALAQAANALRGIACQLPPTDPQAPFYAERIAWIVAELARRLTPR